jgi:hypothetical protein
MHIHRIGDVRVLNDYTEIPGLGFLPVSAFVLHGEEPAVIGTGLSAADKDFRVRSLRGARSPACGRYALLTRTRQTSNARIAILQPVESQ